VLSRPDSQKVKINARRRLRSAPTNLKNSIFIIVMHINNQFSRLHLTNAPAIEQELEWEREQCKDSLGTERTRVIRVWVWARRAAARAYHSPHCLALQPRLSLSLFISIRPVHPLRRQRISHTLLSPRSPSSPHH